MSAARRPVEPGPTGTGASWLHLTGITPLLSMAQALDEAWQARADDVPLATPDEALVHRLEQEVADTVRHATAEPATTRS